MSFASEENEITKLTEEQRLQKRMDEENIHIQVVMRGDGQNFPVRRYSYTYFCYG